MKFSKLILAAFLMISAFSCDDDDDDKRPAVMKPVITLSEELPENAVVGAELEISGVATHIEAISKIDLLKGGKVIETLTIIDEPNPEEGEVSPEDPKLVEFEYTYTVVEEDIDGLTFNVSATDNKGVSNTSEAISITVSEATEE